MATWQETNRIVLGPDGKATRTFTVRLPHREKAGPVEFTAYAFNEDRVKSRHRHGPIRRPGQPALKPPACLPDLHGGGRQPEPTLGPGLPGRRRPPDPRRAGWCPGATGLL